MTISILWSAMRCLSYPVCALGLADLYRLYEPRGLISQPALVEQMPRVLDQIGQPDHLPRLRRYVRERAFVEPDIVQAVHLRGLFSLKLVCGRVRVLRYRAGLVRESLLVAAVAVFLVPLGAVLAFERAAGLRRPQAPAETGCQFFRWPSESFDCDSIARITSMTSSVSAVA